MLSVFELILAMLFVILRELLLMASVFVEIASLFILMSVQISEMSPVCTPVLYKTPIATVLFLTAGSILWMSKDVFSSSY